MLIPLPFSGLSLLMHLGIIVFATGASMLGYSRGSLEVIYERYQLNRFVPLKPALCALALIFIGIVTILFFFTAIGTGIESGQDEPHRIFMKEVVREIGETTPEMFVGALLKSQSLVEPLIEFDIAYVATVS
jgi:hypothetical protein